MESAAQGAEVRFALKATPFYAESGGQIADVGTVSGEGFRIRVRDVQKDEGLVIHRGVVEQGTAVPGAVSAAVDADARRISPATTARRTSCMRH